MTYPIYYFKGYKSGKVVKRIRTTKKLRISRSIALLKPKFKRFDKVYIQIRYAKGEQNEGYYLDYKTLYLAWTSFLEVLKDYEVKILH